MRIVCPDVLRLCIYMITLGFPVGDANKKGN